LVGFNYLLFLYPDGGGCVHLSRASYSTPRFLIGTAAGSRPLRLSPGPSQARGSLHRGPGPTTGRGWGSGDPDREIQWSYPIPSEMMVLFSFLPVIRRVSPLKTPGLCDMCVCVSLYVCLCLCPCLGLCPCPCLSVCVWACAHVCVGWWVYICVCV